MSDNAVATTSTPGAVMERVLGAGDLSKLSNEQRAHYIVKVCESAGLNPLTRPFDIISLNGKLTLYASKGATDQLRRLHNITLRIVDQQRIEDVWQVTVEATTPDGRTDTDIGVVGLGSAKGDNLANALMKAVTKAKRRVTLSICGLGLLDESEFDTIPRQAFAAESPQSAPRMAQATGYRGNPPEAAKELRSAPQSQPLATADNPVIMTRVNRPDDDEVIDVDFSEVPDDVDRTTGEIREQRGAPLSVQELWGRVHELRRALKWDQTMLDERRADAGLPAGPLNADQLESFAAYLEILADDL